MQAMDQAFQEAGALGVTVFCAAGDDGSRDGVKDGKAHADFPATSPNVVACGGTKLSAAGGVITDEVTWNDGAGGGAGGGGISDVFDLPTYQAAAGVPKSANGSRVGRGVPDVAADASPASGYDVRVDGQNLVFGGTSAVAPLMAGLTARLNQALGKPVGFVNPALYGQAASAGAFVDITSGSIGAYTAKAGWDACTGLGRPDGDKLLAALEGPPPAPPSSSSRIGTLTVAAGQSSATQANVVLTSKARIFAELAGDGAGGDVPGVWVRSAVPSSDGRSFEVHLNEAVPAGSQAVVAWMIRSA
jgi:kumamolisin